MSAATALQSAEELVQRAREQIQQHDFTAAQASLNTSLNLKETAAAYRTLGNIQHLQRAFSAGIPYFEKALGVDEHDHASLAMLAEAYFELRQIDKALGYSTLAITANPAEIRYKMRFIAISQDAVFFKHNDIIENTLLDCLKTPELDCSGVQGLWYNTLTLNPVYRGLYATSRAAEKKAGFFTRLKANPAMPSKDDASVAFNPAPFDTATDFSPLLQPFFLLGIEKIIVYTIAFEQFLTHLRKALLLTPEKFTPQQLVAISAALAQYCFNTDYIFDVTDEEKAAVAKLGDSPADIARRACYAPLCANPDAGSIEQLQAGNAELAAVIQMQITEPRLRAAAAKDIIAITPIADIVSVKVRAQYEEFPYPRWKTVPRNLSLERVADSLRKPGASILIAGCGTGHEAAQIATVLPEARILAIDLSLASLSYAQLQTQALGLKNITFRQADILQLGSLQEKFDGIVSSGVLHHLHDPLQGWKLLASLLKPDGLMRIALYSEIARTNLNIAQNIIRKKGFPPTADGMRDFRRQSATLLDREVLNSISSVSDYFHISMYRDMLFHVQEHCFDIPGIEKALNQLHLKFLKFILPQSVIAQYLAAYPADAEAVNLRNWHAFEQSNPQLFIGMYQFWCRHA